MTYDKSYIMYIQMYIYMWNTLYMYHKGLFHTCSVDWNCHDSSVIEDENKTWSKMKKVCLLLFSVSMA